MGKSYIGSEAQGNPSISMLYPGWTQVGPGYHKQIHKGQGVILVTKSLEGVPGTRPSDPPDDAFINA